MLLQHQWKSVFIAIILLILPTRSARSNMKNGIANTSINTSQTTAGSSKSSVPEVAKKLAYQVHQFSGTLSYQIPFTIPKGRNGMTPSIALAYSSSIKMSWPARGWDLSLAHIHRETKFGRPKYNDDTDNTDIFIFSGFGQRLRLVPWVKDGENPTEIVKQNRVEYRAKIEGQFYRFIYYKNTGTNKRWEVWQKNGTVHKFGTTINSRKSFNNNTNIYSWHIDKSKDTNGNIITYSYSRGFTSNSQGKSLYFYPHKVAYGGNENTNLSNIYEVRFALSTNNGNENIKLNSGYKELINHKKLTAIELYVKESGNVSYTLRKKLHLHYATLGQTGGDHILEKAQIEGFNSNGSLKQEPLKFEYYSGIDSLSGGSSKLHPPTSIVGAPSTSFLTKNYYQLSSGDFPGQYTLAGFIDLNGDGLQDFVRTDDTIGGDLPALITGSNNGGWFPQQEGYYHNPSFYWKVWFQKKDGSFADPVKWHFNGTNSLGYRRGCYGCAIRRIVSSSGSQAILEDTFDVDGDGRPDHVITNRPSNGSGTSSNQWCRNNGKGFDPCINLSTLTPSYLGETLTTYNISKTYITDITGDGKPDILNINFPSTNNTFFNVYPGTGQGFSTNPIQWFNPIVPHIGQNQYIRSSLRNSSSAPNKQNTLQDLIDINGDGLPDRVLRPYTGEFTPTRVYFNNGSGFEPNYFHTSDIALNVEHTTSLSQNRVRQMIDMDGDGLVDIVAKDASSTNSQLKLNIWFNKGVKGISKRFSSNPTQWSISTSKEAYLNYTQVLSACGGTEQCDYGVTSMLKDLNGDGKIDLVYIENGTWKIQKGAYPPPYMLKSVQNGHGLKVTFTYKPSTAFNDDSTLPSPSVNNIPYKIPYTKHLISSIKVENTNSPSEIRKYSYTDGKYDYIKKEFRGFRTVTVENSKGRQDVFIYAQGEYSNGMLKFHGIKNKATGKYYKYTSNIIHESIIPNNTHPLIKFPFVKEKKIEYLEGIYNPNSSSAKRKVFGYRYDNFGNLTHLANFTWGSCVKRTYKFKNSLSEYIFAIKEEMNIANPVYTSTVGSDICPGSPDRKTISYHDNTTDKNHITKGNIKISQRCIDSSCNTTSDVQFTYDNYGNVLTRTDQNGNINLSYYGASTHYLYPEYTENALGHRQYFSYDLGLGNVLSIRGPNSTDPNNVATQGEERKFEYDPLGRIKKKYVPHFESLNGNSSTYTSKILTEFNYSPLGSPLPHFVKTINYKKFVQGQIQGIEPNISITYYNGHGQTIQTRTTHIENGTPTVSVTDIEYDSIGRKKRTVRPYAYNGTSLWDYTPPIWNNPTTYEYDLLNRIKKIQHPGSSWGYISYEYTPWKTRIIDEEGKIKDYIYNAISKLSEVTEHENTLLSSSFSTLYGYTKWGELSKITDSEGNIVSYSHDRLGRRINRFHFPAYNNGATWSENHFSYDSVGNLTEKTDNDNKLTSYTYDSLNRIKSKTYTPVPMPWFGGSNGGVSWSLYPLGNISYTYDQGNLHHLGRLSHVDDETGQTSFEYDARGRVTKKSISICLKGDTNNCSSSELYTQEMGYYAFGGMHTVTYRTGANPTTIKYDFDAAGRIHKVYLDSPAQPIFAKFFYNPDGTIQAKVSPKTTDSPPGFNTVVEYNYNERGFVTSALGRKVTDPGYTVLHSNYLHLKNGHIRFYQDQKNGIEVNYNYDDLYRLIGMNSEQIGNRSYSYSMTGNILQKTQINPTNGETTTYSYGYNTIPPWAGGFHGPHATTSLVKLDPSGTTHYQYHYGYNGNLKMKDNITSSSELWRYYYDLENRLRRVNLVDKSSGNIASETTFQYRYNGSRIRKTTTQNGLITQDRIYIDGAFEHNLQLDVFDVHVFAAGTRIATIRNATGSSLFYLYHKNKVFNTQVITDHQGDLADERGYFPFGSEYGSLIGFQNPTSGLEYRFNDKEFDSTTGIYYYGSRYYDPQLSRWLSSDKYLYEPDNSGSLTNPQDHNLYTFSLNNPINQYDPDGRKPREDSFSKDSKKTTFVERVGMAGIIISGTALTASTFHLAAKYSLPAVSKVPKVAIKTTLATRLLILGATKVVTSWYRKTAVAIALYWNMTVGRVGPPKGHTNLYHYGRLVGGKVQQGVKWFSTSTSSNLSHYNSGGSLYTYKIPKAVLDDWIRKGLAQKMMDSYKGIVREEIRLASSLASEINKYFVGKK